MNGQDDTIDGQVLDLMLRAGSRWVLWLLLALSLAAVAVALERLWFFVQERRPRAQIDAALVALRRSGSTAALKLVAGLRSMDASVARACLEHAADGPAAVEEFVAAAVESERVRYERGLAFIGTLGNNAPFVGLFGTVLGIIRAFHDLAINSGGDPKAVMAGIAEALVATGIGLLVALPAVAIYNALVRRVETAAATSAALGHELLGVIKSERPGSPATASAGDRPGEAA